MFMLVAKCSCCGKEGVYEMDREEYKTLQFYQVYGRQLGYIQDLFPKVPAWIRSGAIDQYLYKPDGIQQRRPRARVAQQEGQPERELEREYERDVPFHELRPDGRCREQPELYRAYSPYTHAHGRRRREQHCRGRVAGAQQHASL